MQLGFGLHFSHLCDREGLLAVDNCFLDFVACQDPVMYDQIMALRVQPALLSAQAYSHHLLKLAPYIDVFLRQLFHLERADVDQTCQRLTNLVAFRHHFVHVAQRLHQDCEVEFERLTTDLEQRIGCVLAAITEEKLMNFGLHCLQQADQDAMMALQRWCFLLPQAPSVPEEMKKWPLFWQPQRTSTSLVMVDADAAGVLSSTADLPLDRDDFSLIPSYWDQDRAMVHADYCKLCHDRNVDYCRSGFFKQKSDPGRGFRVSSAGKTLHGCPLDQKISEMHSLKQKHLSLAALAVVMVDNPFCAVTGHRICNDCRQSCIYQKQDPVDTPQVESRILRDVLDLPWGVEIYQLLLLWNPLKPRGYIPALPRKQHVLVMGMGPAGFALMHELWLQGVEVTGADGAQLEPWPWGDVRQPVRDYAQLAPSLEKRPALGFGGVCEYGITVRWDKNLLSLVYLSFLRRQRCHVQGQCRFGGTLTVEDAWHLGFDHLVLALGAGLPQALNVPNSLAVGMRQASDFLMALHMLGQYGDHLSQPMALSLPCLVIGAGLTAIDTATEAQAYYLHTVQLVALRLAKLRALWSQSRIEQAFSQQEYAKLCVWASHGDALLLEKRQALRHKRPVCFRALLRAWGGVRLVYRRALQQSPAYRTNPEELQAAIDAGIEFMEHTQVAVVETDAAMQVRSALLLQPWFAEVGMCPDGYLGQWQSCAQGWQTVWSGACLLELGMIMVLQHGSTPVPGYWCVSAINDKSQITLTPWGSVPTSQRHWQPVSGCVVAAIYRHERLLCQSILVATGSLPNTAYGYEHKSSFERDGAYYRLFGLASDGLTLNEADASGQCFFSSYSYAAKRVSVVGDLHPHYHGSVVKALASAQHAMPDLMRHLDALAMQSSAVSIRADMLKSGLSGLLATTVRSCHPLTEGYCLLVLHAPWLAQKMRTGMLFKLRPFKNILQDSEAKPVVCQPCAYDVAAGTLTFMLSSHEPAHMQLLSLAPGTKIACMGPTGVGLSQKPSTMPVLLFSDDSRVDSAFLYHQHYQSIASDVTWFASRGLLFDKLADALSMDVHAVQVLEAQTIQAQAERLSDSKVHVVLHGSLTFVKESYQLFLQHVLPEWRTHISVTGYVGGPMQCMLKGICAQCLQWQIDPETGERTKAVFACSWQDQPLALIDLDHLQQRADTCSALEHLQVCWLEASS